MKQDEYYESIRSKIINNEIVKRVKDYSKRLSDLDTYLYVGKNLSEAGKHYGEGIIKKYSIELTKEFGSGYSERNLRNMRRFYIVFINSKWQTSSAILNKNNYEIISEKVLQKMILEDIPSFLKELGYGFTFIDNEYKIRVGDRYNYIDLLLFNIDYNGYVIIELKINELKKEHIGQIGVYMNYIDKNIKKDTHNKTIGIILVRKNNKYIMEYCSDPNIKVKEYITI